MDALSTAILSHVGKRFVGYQTCEDLEIPGVRPTEWRFNTYRIAEVIGPDSTVLDVGCNSGFLSLLIAKYVKKVVGIEVRDYLIEIAEIAKTKLIHGDRCFFFVENFETFTTEDQFDLIIFCSVHEKSPLTFEKNALRLRDMLNSPGHILFETHSNVSAETYSDFMLELEDVGFIRLWEGTVRDAHLRRYAMLKKE